MLVRDRRRISQRIIYQYSKLHEYQHIYISSIVKYEVIGGFKNVKNGIKESD